MWRVTLLVMVLAVVASGQRREVSQTRPLTPQQQQQLQQQRLQQQQLQQQRLQQQQVQQQRLQQQQQQQQDGQRQQQQQQQQQSLFGPKPPSANIAITEMTPEMLNTFLRSEKDVQILTACFENFKGCKSPHALSLITQIRTLGIGGTCPTCTNQQQKNLHEMIYNFVSGFQTRYPAQWRKILPHLGQVLVGGTTRSRE